MGSLSALRVGSFNVRNGRAFDGRHSWPFRRRSTVAAIASLDADLVALQEVYGFQRRYLAGRLPGYAVVAEGRSPANRGESCPVLARHLRLRILDARTRWYGADPDRPGSRLPGAAFPRIATTCRIEVAGWPSPITFTSTHLDARSAEHRRRSAEQLAGWLDPGEPCVVAGDFNADPDDELFDALLAAGLRHALPDAAGGTNHDFTGRRDGRRLDHVLVSPHFDVLDAGVAYGAGDGRCLPSDHWPVVATLTFRGGVNGAERR